MYNDEWLKKLAKTSDNVIGWGESAKFAQDELIKHYEKLVESLRDENILSFRVRDNIKDIDVTLQFLKVANEKRKDCTTQLHVLVHNPEKEVNKDV
jgi:hypothetical protein